MTTEKDTPEAPEQGAPARPPRKRTPRKAPPAATPESTAPAAESAAPADPEVVPTGTAWTRVMRDVEQITKSDRNTDQHFNFRGIDATMNTVGPSFRARGVFVLPVAAELLESERYQTTRGTNMHGVVTRHDWLVMGPDGTPLLYPDGRPIIMQTLGQAADSGDKGVTKASSVAYRTALLQSLTVPTGERDPDADSHERAADRAQTAAAERPVDPRQPLWARIKELGAQAGANTDAMAEHYKKHMGHVIDGPEATPEKLGEYIERLEAHYAAQQAQQAAEVSQDPDGEPPSQDPDGEPPAESPSADDRPAAEQDATADAPSEAEATEPAAAGTPAPANGHTPAQGPDRRQALWDDILGHAKRLGLGIDATRGDFRVWVTDALGHPVEIDGPEATPDLLTRYAHVLRARADEGAQR